MIGAGLAVFAGLALAQAQAPPAAPAPKTADQGLCSVTGQVVRLGTNQPLKKAFIHVRGEGEPGRASGYGAETDDSGHFAIRKMPPGRYSMYVERVGYLREYYGQTSPGEPRAMLSLAAGESAHDLVFRMVPWSVIAGRVTNEDGEPIAGAQVAALEL